MRETLLNDEQRRDDAHGAVELGPPAQTDQGGSPYQTALDPSAGSAGGGNGQLIYGHMWTPGGTFYPNDIQLPSPVPASPVDNSLRNALQTVGQMRRQYSAPGGVRLGAEVK